MGWPVAPKDVYVDKPEDTDFPLYTSSQGRTPSSRDFLCQVTGTVFACFTGVVSSSPPNIPS